MCGGFAWGSAKFIYITVWHCLILCVICFLHFLLYICCYILFVTVWYFLVLFGTFVVTDCTFLKVARMQFRKIKSETATHAIYLCAWNPVGSTTTLHNFHAHSVSNFFLAGFAAGLAAAGAAFMAGFAAFIAFFMAITSIDD